MRNIFALLLVCLAAMASLTAMAINTSDYVIEEGIPVGDVNGDGTVTAADITALYDVLLNNIETVYIEGLNGIYSTVNGGSGYICRYTASNGLSQYTDVDLKTASNYCFINSKSCWDRTLGVNEGLRCYPFILNANKFYVFNDGASGNAYNKIYTYQLGASEIAEYTTYPNGTKPMFFDIKNNMIGMVLYSAGYPYQVMSCSLNSAKTGVAMENSAGATIYDVWMQTSLDD